MSLFGSIDGLQYSHFVSAFSWVKVKSFVDIGGANGDLCIALAREIPHIHCIIQDIPNVTAKAAAILPEELAGRIEYMAHDYFEEQPVVGADIYHYRWIFHDNSDKYCKKILEALVPALRNGSKVIISDLVVPEPGKAPRYLESYAR
jgi:predicted O-methyltransferase YrrM